MAPPSLGVSPSNREAVVSAMVGEGGATPPKGGSSPYDSAELGATRQGGHGDRFSPRDRCSGHYHNRGRSEPGQFVEPRCGN